MKKNTFLLLLAFSGAVYGDEPVIVEAWLCSPGSYYSAANIVVKAKVFEGRQYGEIEVSGISQVAEYMVKGFNRRWDFGTVKGSVLQYAFILRPSGDAGYFDFSHESEGFAQQIFFCKQST